MLAQIDEYVFEIDSNVTEIINKLSYNFAKVNRVGNNPTHQKVGGKEMEVSFSGYFMLKALDEFDALEEIADKGKPVWYVSKQKHFEVLISDITKRETIFLKSGEYIKQHFDITLKRYYK
jgi:phage protein U